MKRTVLLCSALVMTFATSLAVPAAANETRHGMHVQRVAHRPMIPASAEALSPRAAPAYHPVDTDGLSRNVDECNMGCIDN